MSAIFTVLTKFGYDSGSVGCRLLALILELISNWSAGEAVRTYGG
jgi:hypothetical protein